MNVGSLAPIHRIMRRVALEDHGFDTRCWVRAEKSSDYWGVLRASTGSGTLQAHRVVYERFVGPIPEGYVLDHLCRVPGCVCPTHLEPVTQRENILRGSLPALTRARLAAITHCPEGHRYTPANTYLTQNGGYVTRSCRACQIARTGK